MCPIFLCGCWNAHGICSLLSLLLKISQVTNTLLDNHLGLKDILLLATLPGP